jgi:hypothetical protein
LRGPQRIPARASKLRWTGASATPGRSRWGRVTHRAPGDDHGNLDAIAHYSRGMATKNPTTTIQVHASTQRFLDALKATGQTYEDLILEMAEEHFPPRLIAELKKRFSVLRGPTADEVFERAGV